MTNDQLNTSWLLSKQFISYCFSVALRCFHFSQYLWNNHLEGILHDLLLPLQAPSGTLFLHYPSFSSKFQDVAFATRKLLLLPLQAPSGTLFLHYPSFSSKFQDVAFVTRKLLQLLWRDYSLSVEAELLGLAFYSGS